jgi:hypothetical protein
VADLKADDLVLHAKCTTCKKVYRMTQEQRAEARDFGCAFSPCCHAVATIERAEATLSTRRVRHGQ